MTHAMPLSAAMNARIAVFLGLLGVLAFSFTLPATRLSNPAFGGWTVAFGRVVVAAIVAAAILLIKQQRLLPPRRELRPMTLVVLGVVIGFPVFTSLALETVGSSYGAIVTGLIPAATAGFSVLLAGERPHRSYWAALAIGLMAILSLPALQGDGRPEAGDALLLGAVVVAGLGYAQGGTLARKYGGWRIICWALVMSVPCTLPVAGVAILLQPPRNVTGLSLTGLAYLSVISMCFAFFAWYEGLARGGVARIGRLQLLQPVLTLCWSVMLLGEQVAPVMVLVAAVVLTAVAIGRKSRVDSVRASAVAGPHRGLEPEIPSRMERS
jgi:drug/metabolite transporter (DMT)-like permease